MELWSWGITWLQMRLVCFHEHVCHIKLFFANIKQQYDTHISNCSHLCWNKQSVNYISWLLTVNCPDFGDSPQSSIAHNIYYSMCFRPRPLISNFEHELTQIELRWLFSGADGFGSDEWFINAHAWEQISLKHNSIHGGLNRRWHFSKQCNQLHFVT